MKRWLICALGLLAGLLLLAAYGFSQRPPALALDSQALAAVSCWFEQDPTLQARCYRFSVVEAGQQFTLPVVVLSRADAAAVPGPEALVYLSGGPGGSAYLANEDMQHWQALYLRMNPPGDLVLLDRRGTGQAEPLLQCDFYRREYRRLLAQDLSGEQESEAIFRSLDWCFNRQLSDAPVQERIALTALGTAADGRDLVNLVRLLDYQRWHLWGVSYGTRLALSVAVQQPAGLQSLVLDSVYPPERGQAEEWPLLMSESLARFFQWCDQRECVEGGGEQRFRQRLQQLDERPVNLTLRSWGGEPPYRVLINGQRFIQLVFSAIYDRHLWPDIGHAVAGQVPQALEWLAENFVNNAFDPAFSELVFYASECQDNGAADPGRLAQLQRQAPAAQAPEGQANGYQQYLQGQARWDLCNADIFKHRRGLQARRLAELSAIQVPVLLLAGEQDPITPVDWLAPVQSKLRQWQAARFAGIGHAVVASEACAELLVGQFVRQPTDKLQTCAGVDMQLSSHF